MNKRNYSTYNLSAEHSNSDHFYESISHFADKFLNEIPEQISHVVEEYMAFLSRSKIEKLRSHNEYLIEVLIFALFWNNYAKQALRAPKTLSRLLKILGKARTLFVSLKPHIDMLRGRLLTQLIQHDANRVNEAPFTLQTVAALLLFLEASRDFEEELSRMRIWYTFFKTQSKDDLELMLKLFSDFGTTFHHSAKDALGQFTKDVSSFITHNKERYKNREDIIFCLRNESEYHLNMLCAEILNREFRLEFDRSEKKIVLLPTCMRDLEASCKSRIKGYERFCVGCQKKCGIHIITKELASYGVETRLIPHSSDFSKFLKVWEGNKKVGLVGVACVLNLIKGGYEMRKLGIPAQCVFLDFSGCKGHWSEDGLSTKINLNRLKQIVAGL